MYDIAVIGAGASGVLSALKAKNKNNKIILLEQSEKILKKILVSGNGRCNLTNKNIDINSYHSNNLPLVKEILEKVNNDKILSYFNNIGILTKEEGNLVYPYSNTSSTVVDALTLELKKNNVEIKYNYEVTSIKYVKDCFEIFNNNDKKIKAKYIVISTGGISFYKNKVPVTGYKLLDKINHVKIDTFPSLVKVKTNVQSMYRLKGMRIKAKASIYVNEKLIKNENGEVLFGDGTLSGICIFNLSHYVNKYKKDKINICLDIMPEYSKENIKELIKRKYDYNIFDVLSYFFHKKISRSIIELAKISDDKLIKDLNENEIDMIIKIIKKWSFNITGTEDFKTAQVTGGGLDLKDFTNDLESKLQKNIFVAGEVLDVDAICGGFNLQWAFSSGYLVGQKLNKLTKNEENI